jgi:hypothetical protein
MPAAGPKSIEAKRHEIHAPRQSRRSIRDAGRTATFCALPKATPVTGATRLLPSEQGRPSGDGARAVCDRDGLPSSNVTHVSPP